MFLDSGLNVEGKKVRSYLRSTDLFSYFSCKHKQQLFKLRREGFTDVCSVMQPLLRQAVARTEWLDVVLQMVKPENEFSQFSLY